MLKWIAMAGMASMVIVEPCFAESAEGEDDEYEEVIVRRKKKRPTNLEASETPVLSTATPVLSTAAPVDVPNTLVVSTLVAIPQAVPATPVLPTVEEPDEPPPPPEPPEADAAEPRRLVRYFCKAWKDKDYERMWWAMSPQYRKKVSLKKFKKLFEADSEFNGGLKDENILEEGDTRKGNKAVKTELIFKYPRAKHRIVAAEAEQQPGGAFRFVESPLIPLDMDDL